MQQTAPTHPPNSRPLRILIVRLSAHGDVMHTLPLLAAIKRADPNAYVGWLVEASAAPLLEGHPLIDRLHISHRKRWLKQLKNPFRWPSQIRQIFAFLQELRQENYMVSLDAQGLFKSAIWPFLAGISQRYGFKHTRENADLFYTHKLPPMNIRDPNVLAVERYLDLARALGYPVGKPEFIQPPVGTLKQERIDALLAPCTNDRPLVILAPFTRWPSKHWAAAHWVELMQRLTSENVQLAVIGSPGDQAATGAMLAALPPEIDVLNLVGRTDWPDLYALFARTRLLIGLDSAPLHIANAVGIDVIGLYGPTAPGRTGPIGERQQTLTIRLDCQPCFERDCPLKTHACMQQLAPAQVLRAVQQMLSAPEEGSS